MKIDLTKDEQLITEAIIDARKVQEFLWGELSMTNDSEYDPKIWASVFGKRVDKIKEIVPNSVSAKVELRKRILQQAALSICALRILDEGQ